MKMKLGTPSKVNREQTWNISCLRSRTPQYFNRKHPCTRLTRSQTQLVYRFQLQSTNKLMLSTGDVNGSCFLHQLTQKPSMKNNRNGQGDKGGCGQGRDSTLRRESNSPPRPAEAPPPCQASLASLLEAACPANAVITTSPALKNC